MRFIVICILSLFIASCGSMRNYAYKTDEDPAALNFFRLKWIVPYINNNQHANTPKQCLSGLRKKIPQKWWRYAVEGLYYNLPETSTPKFKEQWIHTADSILIDDNVHAFVLMLRGEIYTNQGNYNDAILCFKTSYKLSARLNQLYRANDAKRYMANCYLFQGEYPLAVKLVYEVFDFLQDKSDFYHHVRKFETMKQLVQIHLTCGAPRKALRWARQCLYFVQHTNGQPSQRVQAYENLAQVFLNLNMPDSAFLILNKSQFLRQKFSITYESSFGDYLLGKTLLSLKRFKEAKHYLQRADFTPLKSNYLKTAEIKIAIAESMNLAGEMDSCLFYYKQALAVSSNPSIQAQVHHKLAEIYAHKGQFQLAFYHNLTASKIFTAYFSPEKSIAFGEAESHHTAIIQNKRVDSLSKLKKTLFNQLFFLLLAISFVAIVYAYFNWSKNKLFTFSKLSQFLQQFQRPELAQLRLKNEIGLVDFPISTNLISQPEEKVNNLVLQDSSLPLRMLTEMDWLTFRESFEKQFPGFISRLQNQFEGLTMSEIRLLLLIKIGLESKSIADISGISLESVYRKRTRLRNRLGLDKNVKLEDFILKF
jgi:tetratricopeptide (TPR) repeat protein/DNA-binding CsgD family transcriptional regulator